MKVNERLFSTSGEEPVVKAYTLENEQGAAVEILDFGGIIRRICLPDRQGNLADIALGQDSLTAYHQNPSCTGSLLGRNANRIANASFSIDGQTYDLDRNLGLHNIHGGGQGYARQKFAATTLVNERSASLILHHLDRGEGGFPGVVDFTVTFTFSEDLRLDIEYRGLPSENTVLNPSHHCYFNLGGHDSGNIENHQLKINAAYFTPNDFECMPTGEIKSVRNTAFDFRTSRRIGSGLMSADEQIMRCNGYDHNFCLASRGYRLAAEVADPASGRRMLLYTDMPGVQLFTANNMPPIPCKDGVVYYNHQGFCLETQYYPNSANQSHFPSPFQSKDRWFTSRTTFCFTTDG